MGDPGASRARAFVDREVPWRRRRRRRRREGLIEDLEIYIVYWN